MLPMAFFLLSESREQGINPGYLKGVTNGNRNEKKCYTG